MSKEHNEIRASEERVTRRDRTAERCAGRVAEAACEEATGAEARAEN